MYNYFGGWNVLKIDLSTSYIVTNVIVMDVNVLYLSIVDKVIDKGNWSLIIIFDWDE